MPQSLQWGCHEMMKGYMWPQQAGIEYAVYQEVELWKTSFPSGNVAIILLAILTQIYIGRCTAGDGSLVSINNSDPINWYYGPRKDTWTASACNLVICTSISVSFFWKEISTTNAGVVCGSQVNGSRWMHKVWHQNKKPAKQRWSSLS